jgi:hypothetical protein
MDSKSGGHWLDHLARSVSGYLTSPSTADPQRSRISRGSFAAFAALLLVAGCSGVTEPDPCGQRVTPQQPLTLANLGSYFHWDDTSEAGWVISAMGVCAHRHSNVEYELRVQALEGVSLDPFVLYGVGRIRTLPDNYSVENGVHVLKGSDNFGIRDYYGDEPGEWTFMVVVEFPYQGSTAADSAYIAGNFVGGEMKAEWWMTN